MRETAPHGFKRVRSVTPFNVVVQDPDELCDDMIAAQCAFQLAVDVDRRDGLFESAGERDTNMGVFGFAGTVDHASHDGDLHFLDACVAQLPHRHLLAQIALDLVGHVLEEGAGGAAAARASGDLWRETPQLKRLQNLLTDDDLFGAIPVRQRSKRGADGVSDALLQQNGDSGRGCDDALGTEPCFG